jgi:hypothetical protein
MTNTREGGSIWAHNMHHDCFEGCDIKHRLMILYVVLHRCLMDGSSCLVADCGLQCVCGSNKEHWGWRGGLSSWVSCCTPREKLRQVLSRRHADRLAVSRAFGRRFTMYTFMRVCIHSSRDVPSAQKDGCRCRGGGQLWVEN